VAGRAIRRAEGRVSLTSANAPRWPPITRPIRTKSGARKSRVLGTINRARARAGAMPLRPRERSRMRPASTNCSWSCSRRRSRYVRRAREAPSALHMPRTTPSATSRGSMNARPRTRRPRSARPRRCDGVVKAASSNHFVCGGKYERRGPSTQVQHNRFLCLGRARLSMGTPWPRHPLLSRPKSLAFFKPGAGATARPSRSCCLSSMRSCVGWPAATWGGSTPVTRSRPRH